jgi:hypothetical protein
MVYTHNSRMTVRVHQGTSVDLKRMLASLKDLDRDDLVRLREGLDKRLRELGREGPSVSGVLEYRPYADGTLQAEVRRYYRKDGSVKEQGPYWYFRFHEEGKQRKLYLGRTDDPEGELARKRVENRDQNT